jgi:hypothetical protein
MGLGANSWLCRENVGLWNAQHIQRRSRRRQRGRRRPINNGEGGPGCLNTTTATKEASMLVASIFVVGAGLMWFAVKRRSFPADRGQIYFWFGLTLEVLGALLIILQKFF